MISKLKKQISNFINNDKDVPLLAGLLSGFYPLLFYYSNNFSAINSWEHIVYFSFFFLGIPLSIYGVLYYGFGLSKILVKYRKHLLFVLLVVVTFALLSQAMFLTVKKKILVVLFVVSVLVSIKLFKHYKKLIILLFIAMFLPLGKVLIHAYEHLKPMNWMQLPDDIEQVKLLHKPNIYLIQPDGYVNRQTLENAPYNSKSELYNWLEFSHFKVYKNFRSNYPASLASNASLFGMKQHQFGDMLFPSLEIPNARDVICGGNPALSILKSNGYQAYFVVQDEYFQQNRKQTNYDYYNVDLAEIPFFSNDNNVKKEVLPDLKKAMQLQNTEPKFFFVEKLMPHHIGFKETSEKTVKERNRYFERIESVNDWIKETVSYIELNDENSIIIILADHGGWVGLESYNDMYSTTDESLINSTFSTLSAIKWNGFLKPDYDENLKTNVNVFRVLFSVLSENKKYLNALEDDSSFNLHMNRSGSKSIKRIINNEGQILVNQK